jgi:hypothetical protein
VAQAMRLIFIILPHRLSVGTFPCTDGATVQKASLPTKVNLVDHSQNEHLKTVAALCQCTHLHESLTYKMPFLAFPFCNTSAFIARKLSTKLKLIKLTLPADI